MCGRSSPGGGNRAHEGPEVGPQRIAFGEGGSNGDVWGGAGVGRRRGQGGRGGTGGRKS